jgi:small GTP-binding protein
MLHRRQKYWLHVEDEGAAPGSPGELYVFDRLSRIILPHHVAGHYATKYAARTPVWQEIEPLHVPRAPIHVDTGSVNGPAVQVVVILGHADHGKTTLLDQLRRGDGVNAIAPLEAGGITQRVGAWTASLGGGVRATFIDTPGQQLFRNMRQHGASAADVVLLVVAADEGILPQTAESAALAQTLELPVVVALNKVDVASTSQVATTRAELAELFRNGTHDAVAGVVETSALTGFGVEALRVQLKEAAAAQATKAAEKAAESEAQLGSSVDDRGDFDATEVRRKTKQRKRKKMRRIRSRGGGSLRPGSDTLGRGIAPATPTAVASVVEVFRSGTLGTLLVSVVREGTLRVGDWYCCGLLIGRIRTLVDETGKTIQTAHRGTAVAVGGVRKAVIRADPSLVNEQAPLGDALMILTMEEAEDLLCHRQLVREFFDAALPPGAAVPFFADSKAAYASDSDGEQEEEENEQDSSGVAAAEDMLDCTGGVMSFDVSQMPKDDTGWSWLADGEVRSVVVKASNASALDTILELVESEHPPLTGVPVALDVSIDSEDEQDEEISESQMTNAWAEVTIVRCGVGGVTASDIELAAENRCDIWCFAPDDATGLSRDERGGVNEKLEKTAKSYNVKIRHYQLLPDLVEALADWRMLSVKTPM